MWLVGHWQCEHQSVTRANIRLKIMNSPSEVKARASKLRDVLSVMGHQLKHTESLEVISKVEGYADWNTYTAALTLKQQSTVQKQENKLLYCSFCGKSQHEVRKLIAGPSVFICDECVDLCNDIITEEMRRSKPKKVKIRIPVRKNEVYRHLCAP